MSSDACSSIVRLNIGGEKFSTTVDTLTHGEPNSMLAVMFSGRHTVLKDSEGYVFVDRDGKHFRHVLNWLRDGVVPDLTKSECSELLREAEYYQLLGLVEGISELLNRKKDAKEMDTNLTRIDIIKCLQSNTLRLRGVNLSGLDLSKLDLSNVNFSCSCLKNVSLSGANLYNANLSNANLEGANLEGACLLGAKLGDANLEGANLRLATLINAYLEGATLVEACLATSNLTYANLEGADLQGANLEGANLKGAKLNNANFKGANLQRAFLPDITNLHPRQFEGANLEGVKLERNPLGRRQLGV